MTLIKTIDEMHSDEWIEKIILISCFFANPKTKAKNVNSFV